MTLETMKINVITLFPELIKPHLKFLPFKKAIEHSFLEVNVIDLKHFSINSYGSVDDKPYGGGKGMIIRVEPIYNALESIKSFAKNPKVILLSAGGKKYTQKKAREFAKSEEITLICGRYEGIDARVDNFCTDKISIGEYVLSGGELPALVIMESITRLIEGVLDKEATDKESYSDETSVLHEHPQYTRPEEFMGMKVPEILLSGNHKDIEKWKNDHSKVTKSTTTH